ncbi:MAG: hypothetical protein IT286_02990 [Proteobacteria bacterium]|jgi:hypothetical protein|nr:hypothetical protein [Pseudomonadota bacterium]
MKLLYLIIALTIYSFDVVSDEKHQHEEKASTENHEGHEEEEAKPNVGPDKGILKFDEHDGFELSPEALKSFNIQTQLLKDATSWELPVSCLLLTGNEKNVYRLRNHAFLRIDISILKKTDKTVRIISSDLKTGDAVVVQGVGFLRIVEVDATSGETGHSH